MSSDLQQASVNPAAASTCSLPSLAMKKEAPEALLSTKIKRLIEKRQNVLVAGGNPNDLVLKALKGIAQSSVDFRSRDALTCLENPKSIFEGWYQENLCRYVQDTLFSYCVCRGRQCLDVVKCLVEELGANVHDTFDDRAQKLLPHWIPHLPPELKGSTPLQMACFFGISECVEYLALKGGQAIVSNVNPEGWCALEHALRGYISDGNAWHQEIVIFLVQNFKFDPSKINLKHKCAGDEYPPVHKSLEQGHTEMTRQLLNLGADVNAKNRSGDTLLHMSANKRRGEQIQLLLDHGADPNMKNTKGLPPILTLLQYTGCKEVDEEQMQLQLEQMIAHGGDIHAKAKGGNAVSMAVVHRSLPLIKYLVEQHKVDIGYRDITGRNALLRAAGFGCIDIVEYLLDKGATDCISSQGFNSVASAVYGWQTRNDYDGGGTPHILSLVSLLLDRKVSNINQLVNSYSSALSMAADSGHAELVQLLLRNGALFGGSHGEEILIQACRRNGHRLSIIRLLLEHAAVGQILINPQAQERDEAQETPKKKKHKRHGKFHPN